MYNTSPAYSIKGKYPKPDRQVKPSPLTYHVQNWNPKKTPSWKIGSDKKCRRDLNENPGPGHYASPSFERLNKFGIIGKQNGRALKNTQKLPSPAQYSPKLLQKSPSMSFAKKYEIVDRDISNPGPGAYERTIQMNTQGSVIGRQKRFAQQKQHKLAPGPGAYEYQRPSSAKVSFGKESRQCDKKLYSTADPGRSYQFYSAGQYAQKSMFDDSTKSSKGFSLGLKHFVKNLQQRPGPGNYDPDFKKIYYANPSFSIPRKQKPVNPDNLPGPSSYQIKVSHGSMYTSFYKSQRKPFFNNKDIPGPGQYQPQRSYKSSPKYSLGISRKDNAREDSPGPGAYQPNKNVVKPRPQSAKIGKSLRYDQKRQYSPGPGSYGSNGKKRQATPSYGFGKESRMKQTIETTPGPADYTIPSSVAYVAPYVYK